MSAAPAEVVEHTALITNDAVIFGILAVLLGLVFYTSSQKQGPWAKFYKYVPALLLCYFLPGLLNTFGLVDGENSNLYFVASRYLLPACLVLLTLSVDLKRIVALGPKALIMFFTGTVGIVLGGPLAILIVSAFAPEWVGGASPNEVWRGMTTIAGSWIGGGANQAAMYELYEVSDDIFPAMIAVDVIVANLWMAVLLFMAGRSDKLDEKRGADNSSIEDLKNTVEKFQRENARIPNLTDFMLMIAFAFGAVAIAHLVADTAAPMIDQNFPALAKYSLTSKFFWLVVTATIIGIALSFTKAKEFEHVGASKLGSVFIYILVATIGMKINLADILEYWHIMIVGLIWISIHATLLLVTARLVKAPTFFIAVGSQANVGGAASAPVVASAFHPALAPVGVLLAVMGYAVGTFAAYLCGQLMRIVAPV